MKLATLGNMFDRLQPVQKREMGVTANVILSLIDRMTRDAPPLPRRYAECEANTHTTIGRIVLNENTEESARRAAVHFQTSLELYQVIGDVEGIVNAKRNIAHAKFRFEGDRNVEAEMLKSSHELYELRVAEYGVGSELTIDAGRDYALHLFFVCRGEEGRELLAKLLATSKQVLGPHHSTTKEVKFAHDCFNIKTNSTDKL